MKRQWCLTASRCDLSRVSVAFLCALFTAALAIPSVTRAEAPESGASFEIADGERILFLGNTFTERDRHFGHLETLLRTCYHDRDFSVRNMSWPGDTTSVQLRPLNFGGLEEHIARQQPTLIFAGYGMNESFAGRAGLSRFVEGYRHLLEIFEKTGARIVLLSPIRHENLGPPLPAPSGHNRKLELYVEAIGKLAEERGHAFVDLFHNLGQPSDGPTPYPLTENGIHLTDYGYWRAAGVIAHQLDLPQSDWNVELDAATGSSGATGTRLSDLKISEDSVRFHATDDQLPRPAPDDPAASTDGRSARLLEVDGLAAGRYLLTIDGAEIVTARSREWSRGVELTDGPQFDRARRLREAVQYKDMLFFHRWRAHNAEYIYGRRSEMSKNYVRATGRGNAGNPSFPREMAQLDRLLKQADGKLNRLDGPRSHIFELTRQ